jgi:hypothetical protein
MHSSRHPIGFFAALRMTGLGFLDPQQPEPLPLKNKKAGQMTGLEVKAKDFVCWIAIPLRR